MLWKRRATSGLKGLAVAIYQAFEYISYICLLFGLLKKPCTNDKRSPTSSSACFVAIVNPIYVLQQCVSSLLDADKNMQSALL
jgi:hypothetical protein